MTYKPECWDDCPLAEDCRKCHQCIEDSEVLASCANAKSTGNQNMSHLINHIPKQPALKREQPTPEIGMGVTEGVITVH